MLSLSRPCTNDTPSYRSLDRSAIAKENSVRVFGALLDKVEIQLLLREEESLPYHDLQMFRFVLTIPCGTQMITQCEQVEVYVVVAQECEHSEKMSRWRILLLHRSKRRFQRRQLSIPCVFDPGFEFVDHIFRKEF